MKFNESEIILCIVRKIEGAAVFVNTTSGFPGSIILPEIAAGRIRNLRNYVSPGKKIVCKVLKALPDHLELTLRRVTAKEREIVLDKHKKELTLKKIISTISKDSEKIIDKIKEKYEPSNFLEDARNNPEIITNYFSKSDSERLLKIISERKDSKKEIKRIFKLKSILSSGLIDIKSILKPYNSQILYLGSSKFSLKTSASNFKEAEYLSLEILEKIEEESKKKSISFELKEKK